MVLINKESKNLAWTLFSQIWLTQFLFSDLFDGVVKICLAFLLMLEMENCANVSPFHGAVNIHKLICL